MRIGLVLLVLLLIGCGNPTPRIPEQAREQQPQAGPAQPWQAHGRLVIELPGRRYGLSALLRRDASGELRCVLMEDGGLLAADLSYHGSTITVHHAAEMVSDFLPVLHQLIGGGWLEAGDSEWRSDRRLEQRDRWRRWYGGDPVVLHYVHGAGWPVTLSDYRNIDTLIIAHAAEADGPWGAAVTLRWDNINLKTAEASTTIHTPPTTLDEPTGRVHSSVR